MSKSAISPVAVNNLDEALTTMTISTVTSTLSALETSLKQVLSPFVRENQARPYMVSFKCTADPFPSDGIWTTATFYVGNNINYISGYGIGADGNMYSIRWWGGSITVAKLLASSSSFTIPASGSTAFMLPSDGVYILAGYGSAVQIQNVVFIIGGYSTASRCSVVNLTGNNIVTINSSNTSSLTFTASNSQANNSITLNIIKLR